MDALEKIRKQLEDRRAKECPHIIRKCAGDESWDFCEITESGSGRIKPCLLVSGDTCEIWEEIQKEWRAENEEGYNE